MRGRSSLPGALEGPDAPRRDVSLLPTRPDEPLGAHCRRLGSRERMDRRRTALRAGCGAARGLGRDSVEYHSDHLAQQESAGQVHPHALDLRASKDHTAESSNVRLSPSLTIPCTSK